jgi:hypothetical protein
VALVLRVAWALYAAREPFGIFGGDQTAYLFVGRSLADGDGYRSFVTGEPSAFWPPGYPLVVAAVALVVDVGPVPGELPAWLGLLQACIGAATVVPVWWLARAASGSPRAGVVAAALVALWPSLILHTSTAHLETVFVAVLVGSLALLARGRDVTGGIALGLAVLTRPFALPVVALVWLARRSWRAAAVVGAIVVAVQLPWVVRNAVVLDAFVPTSTNAGDTLCIDHRDGGIGAFTFADECFEGLDDVPPDRIEVERNARNTREAIEWTLDNPGEELSRWPTRARVMWRDAIDLPDAIESGGRAEFLPSWLRSTADGAAQAWHVVVAPVGGLGLLWLPAARERRRRPATVLVVGTALSMSLIALALYGLPRFNLPVVPFLAIGAAALVDRWWRPRTARAPRGTAPPAP